MARPSKGNGPTRSARSARHNGRSHSSSQTVKGGESRETLRPSLPGRGRRVAQHAALSQARTSHAGNLLHYDIPYDHAGQKPLNRQARRRGEVRAHGLALRHAHRQTPPRALLANLYGARSQIYAHDDPGQYLLACRLLGRRVYPAERDQCEQREAERLTLKLLHDSFSFTRKKYEARSPL